MEDIKNTYLTFAAGGNVFGVSIDKVVEILEYQDPESKATNFPYLLGLIEHRDNIIPLIDAGVKFGLNPLNITPKTCTIVLSIKQEDNNFNIALVVDEVSDVIEFEDVAKQHLETSYKPGYIAFAIKQNDKLILSLDVDKVFSDTEIVSLKKIVKK